MRDDIDCTWKELQRDMGPNGEALYCDVTGTRRKLLSRIKENGPIYNYHMFVNQLTTHQDKLRHKTFDGETEIDITSDWAAGYKMMQRDNPKCSHGTTCNQYVALVLHSPGERTATGGPRPAKCVVWRIWSQAKGNAAWHQQVLKKIAMHYKNGPVPRLKRLLESTDGQRSQFKGRINLGATAELPHPMLPLAICQKIDCLCTANGRACGTYMRPGIGMEVFHDFKASHHASGPVDNYGKDPRIAMDDAVAAGDLTRYNFEQCFDWCVEHMPAPSGGKSHRGTFGANGAYIWEAYSELGRENPRGFPVIPAGRDFQGLEGSNEIYAWRATSAHLPQLEALFIACYCTNCRSGNSERCRYRFITHSLVADRAPKYFTTHERSPTGVANGNDSDDGDYF
jgi:hypothetical protein